MEQIASITELDHVDSLQNLQDYYTSNHNNPNITHPDNDESEPQHSKRRNTAQGDSTSVISLASRIKEMLMEELRAPVDLLNCLEHPDEDLQFYCFDNNRALCAKCLSSGLCTGHQIISFKKAGPRIKRKIEELVCEIESRGNLYELWGKRIGNKKEDLEDSVNGYKDEITREMDELVKKIESKKQELLDQADQLKVEKTADFEKIIDNMRTRKEEITNIGTIIKNSISTMDEAGMCQYYSKKSSMIRSFLDEEESLMPNDPNAILTNKYFQDHFSLAKFQEEIQIVTIQVKCLCGLEDLGRKADMNYYLSHEPEKSAIISSVLDRKDYKFTLPITRRENPRNDAISHYNNLWKPGQAKSPLQSLRDQNPLSPRVWDDKAPLSSRVKFETVSRLAESSQGGIAEYTPSPNKRREEHSRRLSQPDMGILHKETELLGKKVNNAKKTGEKRTYIPGINRLKLGIDTNIAITSPRLTLLEEVQNTTKNQDSKRLKSSMDFEKAKQELVSGLKTQPASSTLKTERNHLRSFSNVTNVVGQPMSARSANNYKSLVSQLFK